MIFSPFEQFTIEVFYQFSPNFVISNSIILLIFILISSFLLMIRNLYTRHQKYELNIFGYGMQKVYLFLYDMIEQYLAVYVNLFFPFFFYIFYFIFLFNLVGLMPYGFTLTSHGSYTFALSFIVWYGILLIGLDHWGLQFFALFFAKKVAPVLNFFLTAIETLSYLSRVFSLALRLLANMIAGHILLDCVIFFLYQTLFDAFMGSSISLVSIIISILPLIMLIVLLLFELGVCALQAYIFVVLSSLYLKEHL